MNANEMKALEVVVRALIQDTEEYEHVPEAHWDVRSFAPDCGACWTETLREILSDPEAKLAVVRSLGGGGSGS